MSDPIITHPVRTLEPVHADKQQAGEGRWTRALALFLRAIAVVALLKGLYHWAVLCGIIGPENGFLAQNAASQATTVFFAVIDLVAGVGLWLLAAWGAVVWLTAAISMAAVEIFFPEVYGGRMWVVAIEGMLLVSYLVLAIQSAREHPQ